MFTNHNYVDFQIIVFKFFKKVIEKCELHYHMKFMCVSYTYKHCMADVYVHYNILFIKLCKIIIVIKDVIILYYHFISWLIKYFFSQQIKAY